MPVGLTSMVSSGSRCGAGGSGRSAKRNQAASYLMCPPGGSWRAGYARGVGNRVKPSGRRRGMNRTCTGSKK